jgi:hypothetical protein
VLTQELAPSILRFLRNTRKSRQYEQIRRKRYEGIEPVVENLTIRKWLKWYLTKKLPDEFGLSIDIGHKKERPINLSDLSDEQVLQLAKEAIEEGI